MKDLIAPLLFTATVCALTIFAIMQHLETPVVQFSNATKECVQVLPQGDCSKLPKKYIKEWVK